MGGAATDPVALTARAVTFGYARAGGARARPAIDGVSLALGRGELVAVIGPNGSGKSTLLALLAGLLAPSTGSVAWAGRELAQLAPRQRARAVALVPQFLRALPEIEAGQFAMQGRYAHLSFWRRPSAADREHVRRALGDADAADFAGRRLDELSGGERQRVLIARALAQEAEIVLVDEPTSALEPEHQVRVFEVLARLAGRGRAVAVVTHELNLASQFATRIVLLERGRVAAEGAVETVLRRDVLAPVYGPHLAYGRLPAGADGERPFVIAWRSPAARPPDE